MSAAPLKQAMKSTKAPRLVSYRIITFSLCFHGAFIWFLFELYDSSQDKSIALSPAHSLLTESLVEQVKPVVSEDIKFAIQTQAQTISQETLENEIASIRQARDQLNEQRRQEENAHRQKLSNLKNEQKHIQSKKSDLEGKIGELKRTHKEKTGKVKQLEKTYSDLTADVDKQKKEQKKIEREQSFAQSVLKESLYSDGTLLKRYRENLSAHLSSYWKNSPSVGEQTQIRSCTLEVSLLPTMRVASVSIQKSSGHALFDQSAQAAVRKAEPFPDIAGLSPDTLPKKIIVVFEQDSCGVIDAVS